MGCCGFVLDASILLVIPYWSMLVAKTVGTPLLRSLAVVHARRGRRLGARLVACVEQQARSAGYPNVTLLTTTAERFFAGLGYARVERACVSLRRRGAPLVSRFR